jgi:hypothetical protein
MATVMLMHSPEATPEQYDRLRELVGWDREAPAGAKLHLAGFGDDGLRVTDVWDSEQSFNTFMEQRLGPGVQELGIQGQPQVKFFALHGIFAPALGSNEQLSEL